MICTLTERTQGMVTKTFYKKSSPSFTDGELSN